MSTGGLRNPAVWSFKQDRVGQLVSAIRTAGSGLAAITQTNLYDPAGNPLARQNGSEVAFRTFNNPNQITQDGANHGRVRVEGRLDEPGTVSIDGRPAVVSGDKSFVGEADLGLGDDTIAVTAEDFHGNKKTQNWKLDVVAGTGREIKYDQVGNTLDDGRNTYEWDIVDNLTAIEHLDGGHVYRTEFFYNSMKQRILQVEKVDGVEVSRRGFIWLGGRIVAQTDGNDVITKRHCDSSGRSRHPVVQSLRCFG